MKNYTVFLLLMLSIICLSCGDKENPVPEAPSIEFEGGTDLKPVISAEGGTCTLTFTASADWSVSVNAVTRAVDWLSISPTQGGAGTVDTSGECATQ